jgi:hypothetical protein
MPEMFSSPPVSPKLESFEDSFESDASEGDDDNSKTDADASEDEEMPEPKVGPFHLNFGNTLTVSP